MSEKITVNITDSRQGGIGPEIWDFIINQDIPDPLNSVVAMIDTENASKRQIKRQVDRLISQVVTVIEYTNLTAAEPVSVLQLLLLRGTLSEFTSWGYLPGIDLTIHQGNGY